MEFVNYFNDLFFFCFFLLCHGRKILEPLFDNHFDILMSSLPDPVIAVALLRLLVNYFGV